MLMPPVLTELGLFIVNANRDLLEMASTTALTLMNALLKLQTVPITHSVKIQWEVLTVNVWMATIETELRYAKIKMSARARVSISATQGRLVATPLVGITVVA